MTTQLLAQQCEDHMVDIGGEIRVAGQSSRGGPWRIGIEAPASDRIGELHRVLHLTDVGLATSGDYRNFKEVDGQRVDHVLDPRTAMPSESTVVSATVVHRNAMLADAYATALMVLPVNEGLRLADAQGFAVYLLWVQEQAGAGVPGIAASYNDAMVRYLPQN